jgi:hypothetical protein
MRDLIPVDQLLSAWIFIYAVLYIFRLVPFNPVLLLYIAYAFVIYSSFFILAYGTDINRYFVYVAVNSFFKVIPIMIVQNDKITSNDVIFTGVFVLVYVIYMAFLCEDIVCLYRDLVLNVIDKNKGRETSIIRFIKEIPYLFNKAT